MEENISNQVSDDNIVIYKHFIDYIEMVYKDKESWALCFSKELPICDNNIDNFYEAKFVVMKDVNIFGLLEKLTGNLDDHYKNKLLSVANGKFDCIYSTRFQKCENLPSRKQQEDVIARSVTLNHNTYIAPSLTNNGQYLVDIRSGLCKCRFGMNGSPCKHQFIFWANRISESFSFLPVLSGEQRKYFSEIAIGDSYPLRHMREYMIA